MRRAETMRRFMSIAFAVTLAVTLARTQSPSATPPATPLDEARAAMAQGKYADAQARAESLLAGLEAAGKGENPEAIALRDVVVEARWRGGKAQEPATAALAEKALEIKRRVQGPNTAGVGKSLNDLAVIQFFVGDYASARRSWSQAIEIRTATLGPDHPDLAESMNGEANLLQTLGDYDDALPLYRRALAIREKAYGPDHPRVAQSLNNLAVLLTTTGDYAEALPLAERSLKIKIAALGEDHPQVASSMTSLANVLWETGDRARAEELFERAQKTWEKALGPDNPDLAASLNNRAELLRRSKKYGQAHALYERALAIWEKAYGPEHERVAIALNNLAELHEAMGDRAEARRLFDRAVKVREKVLGPNHPDLAESVSYLADLMASEGEYDAARAQYGRALKILEAGLGAEHPRLASVENDLALADARVGETAGALDLALKSEDVSRNHLRLTGRSLAEEQALRYAAVRTSGLDLALTLATRGAAPDASRRVFDSVVRSRAVVLDEMAARHRSVVVSSDPEVARLANAFGTARSRLANLVVRGVGNLDPDQYRKLVDDARAEKEEAERQLAAASAEYARQRELGRVGLAQVVAGLPPRSALVSFISYGESSLKSAKGAAVPEPVATYAAIVQRAGSSAPVVVRIGTGSDIDALVTAWKREASVGALDTHRTAKESEAAYRRAGTALRVRVWDPLAQAIGDATRVFIVPDAGLNLVNFGALPTADGKYLVERAALLHYLSAERDVAAFALPAGARGSGLLAVGGPDYDLGAPAPAAPVASASAVSGLRSACGDFDSLRFDPLPAAEREASEVAALWSGAPPSAAAPLGAAVRLVGSSATEARFKREAQGKRVLHVATHGFFLGGECAAAAGTRGLTVVDTKKKDSGATKGISPLLLSGLALAGANQRQSARSSDEDGVLMAEELAGLDLTGVDWAVLSACDTGVGEIRAGEGVFGLRRAIEVAGVRTLVMSLWPVDDDATRTFMGALYTSRLREGADTATALRSAALKVMQQARAAGHGSHPFYWGAFVAAGDWK